MRTNLIRQPCCRLASVLLAAVALANAAIFVSRPAAAQSAVAYKGVAPWQAERVIADYLNRFLHKQKDYGMAKFGNTNFVVRAKIDDLTRLDTPNGVMWTAMFSGAILPSQYNDQAEQDYAQAVIRIYMDKDNRVQIVVNEGQGVATERTLTENLYRMLPETPGHWLDWGGLAPEPSSPTPIESGAPRLAEPEPMPPSSNVPLSVPDKLSGPRMSPQLQQLYDAYAAAKKRYEEIRNAPPGTYPDAQERDKQYRAAYDAWIKASGGNP